MHKTVDAPWMRETLDHLTIIAYNVYVYILQVVLINNITQLQEK